ncbi:MAG: shikimate kinase [Ignavibacteria bacterium]|nr:shikimate kinase [Ignavibacteria bacterium]
MNSTRPDLAENPKRLVFLAGFMGSGKSTIGPILANTLGFDFVDIDVAIEKRVGKSIVQIFAEDGEASFRTVEREILKGLVNQTECVISLGGGTLANEENLDLLRQNGVIVYLHLTPQTIFQRVRHKMHRPLLRGEDGSMLSVAELQEKIERLLKAREQFYQRAHIIVSTDEKRVGITVDEIVKRLRGKI